MVPSYLHLFGTLAEANIESQHSLVEEHSDLASGISRLETLGADSFTVKVLRIWIKQDIT
jgi:hypothetical protein